MYETEFPFIPNARTEADRELTDAYQAAVAFMQTAPVRPQVPTSRELSQLSMAMVPTGGSGYSSNQVSGAVLGEARGVRLRYAYAAAVCEIVLTELDEHARRLRLAALAMRDADDAGSMFNVLASTELLRRMANARIELVQTRHKVVEDTRPGPVLSDLLADSKKAVGELQSALQVAWPRSIFAEREWGFGH
jgi:hypothetical protein